MIVERTSDANGQTYVQTLRQQDGRYVVEHREGEALRHYATVAGGMREAHVLLTGWAFELVDWDRGHTWSRLQQPG